MLLCLFSFSICILMNNYHELINNYSLYIVKYRQQFLHNARVHGRENCINLGRERNESNP